MLVMIEWIIWGIGVYLAVGVVFAAAFVTAGVGRISPAARGSGWGFRLMILPGSAIFWPLLAARWARPVIEPGDDTDSPGVAFEDAPTEAATVDPEAETSA